jgi:hypothetical protein
VVQKWTEQDGGSTVQRHGAASLIPAKTAASGSLSCERKSGKMPKPKSKKKTLARHRALLLRLTRERDLARKAFHFVPPTLQAN